jgi:hypothetical protein
VLIYMTYEPSEGWLRAAGFEPATDVKRRDRVGGLIHEYQRAV